MSSVREYREIAAHDFITDRASELIYHGRLDEDVVDRFEVIMGKILESEHFSPSIKEILGNLISEIVRFARAGEYR